jgi:hypothetical protein
MFSESIINSVDILNRHYEKRKRFVEASYPIIEITIEEKKHRVSFRLFFLEDKYFEIQNPTYHYFSKISHFDFKTGERRWSRDKKMIFSIISDLKLCGLWEMVKNKDFLKINDFNDNIDREKLKNELDRVINEDSE